MLQKMLKTPNKHYHDVETNLMAIAIAGHTRLDRTLHACDHHGGI